MIVAIHQPEYLPWPGLLAKARRADVFVLLDDVQFNRASLQHRAKIAVPWADFAWLTIPFVHAHPQLIRDVRTANQEWPARHLALLAEAYADAPALGEVLPQLRALLLPPSERVAEVATASMALLLEAFGIAREVVHASSLEGVEGMRGERVLSICQRLGATRYLAGRSGALYLDREVFAAAGVEIEVQAFPTPRRHDGRCAVDGLSALDAWMHLGDKAKEVAW